MFFNHHGENINLSGDEISWANNTFDGCAVANRALEIGDEIDVIVDGGRSGGHVLLGFTASTDDLIKESIRTGTKLDAVSSTLLKVFKNQSTYRLKVISNNEIVKEVEDKVIIVPVNPGSSHRLCAMLLFGFMDVTIKYGQSKSLLWYPALCGTNVSISQNRKTLWLLNGNPYALCACANPLVQNKPMGFDVSSVEARWYYLKTYVSSLSPKEAAAQGWENSMNELQSVVKIRNPKEQLIIQMIDSTISFDVGINSPHSFNLNVISDHPIYIYFELFRVKLRVKAEEELDEYESPYVEAHDPQVYDYLEGPSLYVQKQGEAKKSEKATETLNNLITMLSNPRRDESTSKMTDIYTFIRKFDKDLSTVENHYQGSSGSQAPPSPKPIYSDGSLGATSACSTCTPTLYLKSKNEDLTSMINDLKKRVSNLERKKKITIATTVDFNE